MTLTSYEKKNVSAFRKMEPSKPWADLEELHNMRNVDCEWLVHESHNCCHRQINQTGWTSLFRTNKCIEYRFDHVDCHYRESLWDMLKKKNPQNNSGTKGRSQRPPPPPPAPSPRIFVNNKLVDTVFKNGSWVPKK